MPLYTKEQIENSINVIKIWKDEWGYNVVGPFNDAFTSYEDIGDEDLCKFGGPAVQWALVEGQTSSNIYPLPHQDRINRLWCEYTQTFSPYYYYLLQNKEGRERLIRFFKHLLTRLEE